jgi:uncharacterized protein (DUF2141 family)
VLFTLALSTLLAAPPAPLALVRSDSSGVVSVVVRGLRSERGHVLYVLFDDPDAFPGEDHRALRRAQQPIKGNLSRLVWRDLPPGTYAIAVVHDENDNEALDTNFLGIPKEGIGASNNAKGRLGPPKWKDAKFLHDGELSAQIIRIVYY